MRLLLDTHVFLWWLAGDTQLPRAAEDLIASPENEVFASAASVWEIAIKAALGRIRCDPAEIEAALGPSGLTELPVTAKHAVQVSRLPLHHRDPFDRILLAQSLAEPMRLLTHNKALADYGEMVIVI